MRRSSAVALMCMLASMFAVAQKSTSANPEPATATCNFDNQKQLTVQYQQLKLSKKDDDFIGHEARYGRVWEPGKKALTLYTNTPLTLAGNNLAVGAYTLYLIPDHRDWTLVVSRNTDVSAKYDKSKDLMRAPMEIGQLPLLEPEFSVYFAHTGPTECTMRVDIADTRAWVPFFEQK